MTDRRKNGFTLIELLVVVSIVALLASVVMTFVRTTRVKARDARRVADLKQIRTGLELYYSDYRRYPGMTDASGPGSWSSLDSHLTAYISPLPKDPLNSGPSASYYDDNYVYYYASPSVDWQDYSLIAQFEDKTNTDRCELKCWQIHHFTMPPPFSNSWCDCIDGSQTAGLSKYLYSDH